MLGPRYATPPADAPPMSTASSSSSLASVATNGRQCVHGLVAGGGQCASSGFGSSSASMGGSAAPSPTLPHAKLFACVVTPHERIADTTVAAATLSCIMDHPSLGGVCAVSD